MLSTPNLVRSPFTAAAVVLVVGALITGSAAAMEIPPTVPAPLAAYDFDDCTVTDITGNGHDGAVFGPVCSPTPYGHGFEFDGVDDYLRVTGGVEDFGFQSESVSVSCWAKIVEDVDTSRTFWVIGNYADEVQGHTMSISKSRSGAHEGRIGVNLGFSNGIEFNAFTLQTGVELPKNHWLHVVGVLDWDARTLSLYLDGELQQTTAVTAESFDFTLYGPPDVVLGNWNGVGSFHDSALDEFAVWNTALAAEEVADLFAAGRNPVRAWWTFEEGAGDVLQDVSHNGNDGTVVGAAWSDGALAFDGVDDHVALAMTPRYQVDDPFTWEVVARFAEPTGPGIQAMLGLERTNNGEIKIAHQDAAAAGTDVFASARTDLYNGESGQNLLYGDTEYLGTGWHAYALVRDPGAGECRLYVDRVLVDTHVLNDVHPLNADGVPLAIGAQIHRTSSDEYLDMFFGGEIAEARIADVVLAEADLLEAFVAEPVAASFTQSVDVGPAPLVVQFTSTATGTITGHAWDFGDGQTSTEADPEHTFETGGIFTVQLTVTGPLGVDTATSTVTVLVAEPVIVAVGDVHPDQGRWVFVDVLRSVLDTGPVKAEIYGVERHDAGGWTAVGAGVAYGETVYRFQVPTLADSTAADGALTEFRVVAGLDEGTYFSEPATGYSTDDIGPDAPQNLVWLAYSHLAWDPVAAPDLAEYRVHGVVGGELVEPPVAVTTGTDVVIADLQGHEFFAVVAVDDAGLRSDPADTAIPLDVPSTAPDVRMSTAYPNPFNPVTHLEFTLPRADRVRLRVYDVSGRLVRELVDGIVAAGTRRVAWQGQDEAGRAVPSGTYFARLETGGRVITRSMMLLK